MASFGVGVSNPFDLLTEDGQAPKQAAPKAEDKKSAPKQPKKEKSVLPQTGGQDAGAQGKPGAARGAPARGRGAQRGAAGRQRGRGGATRGSGHDAHPMNAGGAHGGAAHGQRTFERRSASGRGREVRKGGAGGYGAGGTWKDDVAAEGGVEAIAATANPAPVDPNAPVDAAAPAAEEPAAEEFVETEAMRLAREEEEAEAKKLTFDQFMALKAATKVAEDEKRQIRKVENDEKRFKQGAAHQKESVVMFEDAGKPNAGKVDKDVVAVGAKAPGPKAPLAEAKKDKKEKKKLNIDEFKVKLGADLNAPVVDDGASLPQGGGRGGFGGRGRGGFDGARGRGGRGRGGFDGARGRGGFDGARGRGAPRGGPRGNAGRDLQIQSEDAFPKLGK